MIAGGGGSTTGGGGGGFGGGFAGAGGSTGAVGRARPGATGRVKSNSNTISLPARDSPRGVVLTASYEARPFGVGSAMPMQRARRLCPQALVVPPRFDRYQEISQIIMTTFDAF